MKRKNLYLTSGYLNSREIYYNTPPFVSMIGGRGIGKTYGMLELMIEDNIRFMYLRRLQTQVDIIKQPKFNPMKELNDDKKWQIYPHPMTKSTFGFFYSIMDDSGKWIPIEQKFHGYCAALSTFSNLRGFSASDIECIIYDEFVPEETQPYMRGEASAFFNLCETVGRNRELKGLPPLKVIFMSNSTDAANPIYMELGIVMDVISMQEKKIEVRDFKERDLTIIIPHDSPISQEKNNTSLYRFTKGTQFAASSIENKFINNKPTSVKSMNLKEYSCVVKVGEICIYKHKSNGRYYVSRHSSGSPEVYGCSEKELAIFRRRFVGIQKAVYLEKIDYEDYTCELLFDKYMNPCYI